MRYFIAERGYIGYSSKESYVLDHSEGDFQVFKLIAEVPLEFAEGRVGKLLGEEDLKELKEKFPQVYSKLRGKRRKGLTVISLP